jgi:hypothetical protein
MNEKYERGILLLSLENNNFTRDVGDEVVGLNERKSNSNEHPDKHIFITDDLNRFDHHVSKKHVLHGRYNYFMDLNRYSKNVIIVEFPQGTGGSFLISCLNLSDSAAQYLSKEDKINYIQTLISKSKSRLSWFDPINFSFTWDTSEVEKSINNNEFTFFLTHHYDQQEIQKCTSTKSVLNFFHNAKVVRFENWIPFYIIRKYFPEISFDNYLELNFEKRKELFSSIDTKSDINLINHLNAHKNVSDYTWDTSNFFDRKCFLNGIEKLYDDVGLSGFDGELVGWYYDEWVIAMRNWGRHK